jgi:hypothetical protein
MNIFLRELKHRNSLLYWFGWYNFAIAIGCIVVMQFDDMQILGINRWIKPMKFFLSVGIMVWTMGWILYYLQYKRAVKSCSWLIVISMFFENFIITLQSARGERSHFNVHVPLNAMFFSIMAYSSCCLRSLLFTLLSYSFNKNNSQFHFLTCGAFV